jgi:hypothetical protein
MVVEGVVDGPANEDACDAHPHHVEAAPQQQSEGGHPSWHAALRCHRRCGSGGHPRLPQQDVAVGWGVFVSVRPTQLLGAAMEGRRQEEGGDHGGEGAGRRRTTQSYCGRRRPIVGGWRGGGQRRGGGDGSDDRREGGGGKGDSRRRRGSPGRGDGLGQENLPALADLYYIKRLIKLTEYI